MLDAAEQLNGRSGSKTRSSKLTVAELINHLMKCPQESLHPNGWPIRLKAVCSCATNRLLAYVLLGGNWLQFDQTVCAF